MKADIGLTNASIWAVGFLLADDPTKALLCMIGAIAWMAGSLVVALRS